MEGELNTQTVPEQEEALVVIEEDAFAIALLQDC